MLGFTIEPEETLILFFYKMMLFAFKNKYLNVFEFYYRYEVFNKLVHVYNIRSGKRTLYYISQILQIITN